MKTWLPLFVICLVVISMNFWAQQVCTEIFNTFTENFDEAEFKDVKNTTVINWPSGPISLPYLGGNFAVMEPAGMGAKMYVTDAGDFNGDGYPDLIGLDIANNYRLILVENFYEDLNGDGLDDDGKIFFINENEVYEEGLHVGPASISVADYNDDGLLDFFFYKNRRDEFGYTEFVAAMYINRGTATDPDFEPHNVSPTLDFTQKFMSHKIYCNWAADHLFSIDMDNDEDIDMLVISQDRIYLVRNPGVDNFDVDHWEITELSYDERTKFTGKRGGSSVDAADFDRDGDIDVIAGTVHDVPYLVYYQNDGTGNFTRQEIPITDGDVTGTVATAVADFDNNAWPDIFGGNDRWNAGNYAHMWIFRSRGLQQGGGGGSDDDAGGINWEFKVLNNGQPILPSPHDIDMSAYLDFDQDGDYDVILADANHSGDYYLIVNELAPVYALYGEAWSTSYTPDLDLTRYAITRARIVDLDQRVKGGSSQDLSVEFYFSNNGRDWEFYQRFEGSEIKDYTNLPWHAFNHFGSHIMWKAILRAAEDNMEEYDNASFETPLVEMLKVEYVYVERREYSRTSTIVTNVDDGGNNKTLLIAGSFYFPGWQGHLRAYDITGLTPETSSQTVLRTISESDFSSPSGRKNTSGVTILWDAGELLDVRSHSTRKIYTAVEDVGELVRLDFDESEVATLGPLLQDVNGDNKGLIRFVRGEDRYWKLGDIDHSNPLLVGPPEGTQALMGGGYDAFKTTWNDRRKMVYVGTNEGMIHCFDAVTGEEKWGFIPYNLLPKLRNMWVVDPATGGRYFVRDVYVDGSPVASDVYIDADGNGSREWRTVLICGQGTGKGSTIGGGINYYFALDITDPDNPQPLWQFTDATMGETWSVPTIGKVTKNGKDTWVAFMGSGYDNDLSATVGNVFYAVDIETGEAFWTNEATDVVTADNIPNTIPGSPNSADVDGEGHLDVVYVPDLDGRLWKVDVSKEFKNSKSWKAEVIYQDKQNYPIFSKPAIWIDPGSVDAVPRLYFGMGGDDRAPDDVEYAFIALMDAASPEVEWFIGDDNALGLSEDIDKGDLGDGEKVWADPKVANYIVYFSTLTGSIESVDPCQNLAGIGKLYGRYVKSIGGSTTGGSTALDTIDGPQDYLNLLSKSRSAVTLGGTERTVGSVRKKEVYIQEYDSTIQKLEQPVGANLAVKSWREIYRIIKKFIP